jgi:polyhydroxybutyrate depolymerase
MKFESDPNFANFDVPGVFYGVRRLSLLVITCASCATFRGNSPLTSAGPARTTRHTLVAGGRTRSFYLRLPPHFTTSERYPLLILLHGHNNNGANVLHQAKMEAVADQHGAILVAPNGTGRFGRFGLTWNVGTCCGSAQAKHVDDVAFLATLIDTLAATLPIDRSRVVLAGFSAGGMLALRVACDRSSLAAAYINVQGTMPDTTCAPSRPVSMLLIEGDEDEDMREEHAENKRHGAHVFAMSAMGTLRFWARHDRCDTTLVRAQTAALTAYSATACEPGTATELVTIHGHPHAWPGGHRTWLFSPRPSPDVDASELIFGFLDSMPGAAGR